MKTKTTKRKSVAANSIRNSMKNSTKPVTGNSGVSSDIASALELARIEDRREEKRDKQRKSAAEVKAQRIANLKSWQPGQSGNASGRPKKKPWTEALDSYIDAYPERVLEAIDHLFDLATGKVAFSDGAPAVQALKLMIERVEGKMVQMLSGPGGGPLPIKHQMATDHEMAEFMEACTDAELEELERLLTSHEAIMDRVHARIAEAKGNIDAARELGEAG